MSSKMNYLNRKERNAIKKFSELVKETLGNNLISLMLFGSKIRRDFTKDSDIDILLVLKGKNVELRDKIYDILFKVDPYYELKISLKIFSKFEYSKNEELHSPFVENIKKEGIVI